GGPALARPGSDAHVDPERVVGRTAAARPFRYRSWNGSAQHRAERTRRLVRFGRPFADGAHLPRGVLLGPEAARVSVVRDPGAHGVVLPRIRARAHAGVRAG